MNMKSYDVVVRTTITKTLTIKASSEEKSEELAHESFSVLNDRYFIVDFNGKDEKYDQETLGVTIVNNPPAYDAEE